jgi:hypothetical protein
MNGWGDQLGRDEYQSERSSSSGCGGDIEGCCIVIVMVPVVLSLISIVWPGVWDVAFKIISFPLDVIIWVEQWLGIIK